MALASLGLAIGVGVLVFLVSPGSSNGPGSGHAFLESLRLDGLDACGAAVDAEGNLYVADPSNSVVAIYSPGRERLAMIRDVGRPCDLAVDSNGLLYVARQRSGDVARYRPASYPFDGKPAYGDPETIDAGGNAKAIAVDPYDDRLFVAGGGHVVAYRADRGLGENELQRVLPFDATGGTYRLSFQGDKSEPIPHDATHAEVDAALEALPQIGRGSVDVKEGPNGPLDHLVEFTGARSATDLPPLDGDGSALRGIPSVELLLETKHNGFSGQIGAGSLSDPVAVGVYTYPAAPTRYLYVADSDPHGPDRIEIFSGGAVSALEHRVTLDRPRAPDRAVGADGGEAAIGVDQRNGHFFIYDAGSSALEEFEATGTLAGETDDASLGNPAPTGIAIDGTKGAREGNVYVATGGTGVLAFGPQAREPRRLASGFPSASQAGYGLALDAFGNVYVANETAITVYGPDGDELTEIPGANRPYDVALDSLGAIYAIGNGASAKEGDETVVVYEPDSYPPTRSTRFGAPREILSFEAPRKWIVVNPLDDHLLASLREGYILEYGSARKGSPLLRSDLGSRLLEGVKGFEGGLAICSRTGQIYVGGRGSGGSRIYVLNPKGTEMLTEIDGSGSPSGPFASTLAGIAVDQATCHILVTVLERSVEEYESSGAFVREIGPPLLVERDVEVDRGGNSPHRGRAYMVDAGSGLTAFEPSADAAP